MLAGSPESQGAVQEKGLEGCRGQGTAGEGP